MDVYYIRNMYSKKCNKITLNNLHEAGPNKPVYIGIYRSSYKKTVILFLLDFFVPSGRMSLFFYL